MNDDLIQALTLLDLYLLDDFDDYYVSFLDPLDLMLSDLSEMYLFYED